MYKRKRRGFILPVAVLITASLVALTVFSAITSYSTVYNESINAVRQQNSALVNRLEGWLNMKSNQLENNHIFLLEPDVTPEILTRVFTEQGDIAESISMIMAGFPDGSIIHGGYWPGAVYTYAPDRIWYIAAAERPGEIFFLPPYWGPATQRFVFTVARTIGDADTSEGVIAMSMPFYVMQNFIAAENDTPYSYSFVLDDYGNILFHPDPAYAPIDDLTFLNIYDTGRGRMFDEIRQKGSYSGGGALYVGSLSENVGWYVITRIPTSYITAITFPTITSIVINAFLALSLVIGAWVMLHKIRTIMNREREAHAETSMFFDSSPILVEIWDEELNLLDCNRKVLELYNAADVEEYTKSFPDIDSRVQPCGTPSMEKYDLIRQAFEEGFVQSEWVTVGADGEQLPFDCTFVRLSRRGENVVVIYSHDLRPVKAAMEKEREAEEESRAKTRFLARMSHELRTPMSAVIGIAELQLQDGNHPPETEEAFLRIHNSSNLLLTIINDILDLSKIEADKMDVVPAVYEFASMVIDTVQLNMMHIGSKHIEFKLNIDERLPAYLIGDEQRIKQILNNLLSNAFKYTQEGQITLSFGIEPAESPDEIMLTIRVQDTGMGMTREQIDSLFEIEFTRFNVQSNHAIEGSGLGLMIAHRLITIMRGSVTVDSEAGKGSTFTVRIPQTTSGVDVLGKESVENLQNLEVTQRSLKKFKKFLYEPMPYGRVMVVDDVESNLYVVKEILLPYKIEVEAVTGGYQAIERVKAGEVYDIIFMDHMMPDMDGIEATKIIRKMGYSNPVVALTANVVKGVPELFMSNGFDGFIAKPIDLAHFDSYLVRYIRDKHPEEAQKAAAPDSRILMPGSDDVSAGLLEAFLQDIRKAVEILEPLVFAEKFDEKALKSFVLQTHAMKSALHNIGRKELSELSHMLEKAGRSADIEKVQTHSPLFLDSLWDLIAEISPKDDEVGSDDAAGDLEYVRDALNTVAEACERFDYDSASAALDSLGRESLSRNMREFIKDIEACLLHGDFNRAAELAKSKTES